MNLDELQSIRDRERQSDSLQQLRESFYADVGDFLGDLREEREAAADRADDPFDAPEVNRLTDDIKTAEQTVEAIYERRVGKLVKMASFAAADMPTDDEGLTAEERDLFERLVESIERNRQQVFAVVDGDDPASVGESDAVPARSDATATGESASPPPGADSPESSGQGVDAADLMGGGPAQSDAAGSGPGSESPPDADSGPESADPREATEPTASTDPPSDGGTPDPSASPGSDRDADVDGPGSERDEGAATSATPVASETERSSTETATEQRHAEGDGSDETGDAGAGRSDGSGTDVSRTTVRITRDVGEIFGVDEREYDLSPEDVVTLPAANAEPLVERDAAERID